MTDLPRGLRGVVAAKSAISYVDGTNGLYNLCGYDIREIAGRVSFEEAAHLVWTGELPTSQQLKEFVAPWRKSRELPEELTSFLKSVPQNAIPMSVLRSAVSLLGMLTYLENPPQTPPEALAMAEALRPSIAARMSVIVATYSRLRQGLSVPPVREDLGEAAHFLYMLHGEEPSQDAVDAFETSLVLHCDHGFNNSTFTARVVGSSLTDVYSVIIAAIGSLNGPLHGGANSHVIPMLLDIKEPERTEEWVLHELANKRVIMGIGHPVYKTVDPRKEPLKRMALKLTNSSGEGAKLIEIAERIEAVMNREKGLHANVDLFSAPLFYTMGIPVDLFTNVFAISRTVGWLGQLCEQLSDNRIFRPECDYIGHAVGREYVPIEER